MPTSYNGWTASRALPIRPLIVAGEPFTPGIRDDDDVYTVLQYVAEQMHARVEPIVKPDWHQADDWGYYYRPNTNNPTQLSCHASGTAIDYNATRHPNGTPASASFTPTQISEIRRIIAEVDGAVRWGGDFKGTPDPMHFEIAVSPGVLSGVASRIRHRRWFEMASKDELRSVVAEVVAEAFNAYKKEQLTVKTANGTPRTLSRAQWEREVFQKAAKAAKA